MCYYMHTVYTDIYMCYYMHTVYIHTCTYMLVHIQHTQHARAHIHNIVTVVYTPSNSSLYS